MRIRLTGERQELKPLVKILRSMGIEGSAVRSSRNADHVIWSCELDSSDIEKLKQMARWVSD